MQNDLLCEFDEMTLDKSRSTSATKLRQLMIKLDTYKKRSNTTMRHLREIRNLIKELKTIEHVLFDEQ